MFDLTLRLIFLIVQPVIAMSKRFLKQDPGRDITQEELQQARNFHPSCVPHCHFQVLCMDQMVLLKPNRKRPAPHEHDAPLLRTVRKRVAAVTEDTQR
jgi:hypothetical protein